ncbi:MAG: hypothetical protein R3B13_17815 [Polyangiaceae bacterium]
MSRDKQTILERRRRFLAAALASAGVVAAAQGCGRRQADPEVCLSPEYNGPVEYAADAGPATDDDELTDAGSAADSAPSDRGSDASPQPQPQPCLSDIPPQVCLSQVAPPNVNIQDSKKTDPK